MTYIAWPFNNPSEFDSVFLILMQKHTVRSEQRYASPEWRKIKQALNAEGVISGGVLDDGEWRSTFKRGGVAAFSARRVDLESGLIVRSVSANRNQAIKNAAFAAHAASQDARNELQAKLKQQVVRKHRILDTQSRIFLKNCLILLRGFQPYDQ